VKVTGDSGESDTAPVGPNSDEEGIAMMYWNGMGGWGYLFMTVNTLLFWGLVVTGIVLLVRHFGGRRTGSGTAVAGPEQILAERYARGDIDDEEYQRRLDTLRRGGHAVAES
jgi:putative membrane protein